jgi:hypothetical protein
MRARSATRWVTCALALSMYVPALADGTRTRKSLTDCASFDQTDKGEDRVELTIHNRCSAPLACSISWRVVCAPDSHKRRSVHPGASKLALVEGGTDSAVAAATECGDDGWSIDHIEWSCKPNDD